MFLEVALIEWSDAAGGMRLLGRSRDPQLVDAVRGHLADRLLPAAGGSISGLRVIQGGHADAEASHGAGHSEGDRDA